MSQNPPETGVPSESAPGEAGRDGSVRALGWGGRILSGLAALVVRAWWRSLRVRVDEGSAPALFAREHSTVIVIWHNRLFLSGAIYRRFRHPQPTYALISASRDGSWLSALLGSLGLRAVRGSSSRRSQEAAREMVRLIRSGSDIAISPDGPRGPCYSCKEGVVMVARLVNAPILLLGAEFDPRFSWRLNSWDGFYLTLPFAPVRVRGRLYARYEDLGLPADREQAAAALSRLMTDLNPDTLPDPRRVRRSEPGAADPKGAPAVGEQ